MRLKLYWNTLKYLKPIQIIGRVRHILSKYGWVKRVPFSTPLKHLDLFIPELDADPEYVARLKPELLLEGKISLLNRERELTFKQEELISEKPLWKFNLQYFEYLIGLSVRFRETNDEKYLNTTIEIFNSYLDSKLSPAPYVASLQITNLLIVLDILDDRAPQVFANDVYAYIFRTYRYLLSNMEVHLLGNHYYENLKAVLFASIIFGDQKSFKQSLKNLQIQTEEQFLPDGMHFELSPMYHKIMLEDLLRLVQCLNQESSVPEWLYNAIQQASNAMAYLEEGVDRTPLFNDAGDNVSKTSKQLQAAIKTVCGIEPVKISSLPFAGYYRLDSKSIIILEDVGKIGPDYIPGHGHCDCLSFELFLEGKPLFVNSGTYQYQGKLRKYFRSTRSHNTVEIDRTEQSECWAEHRVARRICDIKVEVTDHSIKGSYINYKGDMHERFLSLKEHAFAVMDKVVAKEGIFIHSYLHLGIDYHATITTNSVIISKDGIDVCSISLEQTEVIVHTDDELAYYAPNFGCINQTECLEFIWKSDNQYHGYKINFKI